MLPLEPTGTIGQLKGVKDTETGIIANILGNPVFLVWWFIDPEYSIHSRKS